MSVPTRMGAYTSASAALRVKRGSTTMSLAFRVCMASVTHLNPQGCASAALPPMIENEIGILDVSSKNSSSLRDRKSGPDWTPSARVRYVLAYRVRPSPGRERP